MNNLPVKQQVRDIPAAHLSARMTLRLGVANINTNSWAPAGTKSIYLRLYTHQDLAYTNVEDFALYAGQSIQVQAGDYRHKEKIQTGDSHYHPHYSQAKISLPANRHMIPIIIFDEATSGALINMLEETAIAAFNCVHDVQKLNRIRSAIANEARQASSWQKLE
ncbi:unnamed protein product [Clonostachys rhizophaga]|uniref:Uncharacterized protein n=1 Tax=Clonostachys rhizophaga TaxID=160324 RepID=A0A9N9V2I0_9HYPO|nr:unnamed protein product [Clonostachys rhizophaga]